VKAAAATATLALAVAGAHGQELFRLDPLPGTIGLLSQDARNPGGLGWFAEAADEFTAGGPWSIGRVEFWGFYDSLVAAPEATHAFVLRVYSSDAGMPGTELAQREVTGFSQEPAYPGTYTDYQVSAPLAPPITLPGPGVYFLSVVAVRDSGGGSTLPQWHWLRADSNGPPPARQWTFSPGLWTPSGVNASFVLHAASCYPDCNGDSAINLSDFGCFQTKFALGDPYADCNGDSVLNLSDFGCFQTKFALGCP
jgi:hypothetical protein